MPDDAPSRGQSTSKREHSDVDLLVMLPPGTSALALGGLLLDAQELLGRPQPADPRRIKPATLD